MTNFELVKQRMSLDDMPKDESGRNIFCKTIHDIRHERNCNHRDCKECKEWLEADVRLLDRTEAKYLSNIIKPYKIRVFGIAKVKDGKIYHIRILVRQNHKIIGYSLPGFKNDNMYRGMKLEYVYTLEELGL